MVFLEIPNVPLGTVFAETVTYIIAVSWVIGHRIYSSVSCWLHFLTWRVTWTIWYRYLYTKNYTAVYTYHQLFCCLESVNTKRENPMVYGANFMQCVCTGYCESWKLSSLHVLWTLDFMHIHHVWLSCDMAEGIIHYITYFKQCSMTLVKESMFDVSLVCPAHYRVLLFTV